MTKFTLEVRTHIIRSLAGVAEYGEEDEDEVGGATST